MAKPDLDKVVFSELDRIGVDGVKIRLGEIGLQPGNPKRQGVISLNHQTEDHLPYITRDECEQWLAWKASIEAKWIRIGALAAVAAAIIGLVAIGLTIAAWRWPVSGSW